MFQTTRNRLVAPGLPSSTRLEALVFEPWHDLSAEMDRLVSAVIPAANPNDGAGTAGSAPGARDAELAWVPAVDVEEREDGLALAFEVPGVAPEALEVTVDGRVLTVRGERALARAAGDAERRAYHLERRYGRFARSLTLPPAVDPDRIQARYEHGVLHLDLPKRPEAQPRRIAVAAPNGSPNGAPNGAPAADQRRLDRGAADA